MLETLILCLTYYPVTFLDMLGRPFRDRRRLTIPGVATAADGLVALGCGTGQQWLDFCAMVGHPEWMERSRELSITEQANIHAEQIDAWVREHTVDEILDLATAFRIPNAPIGNGANVPRPTTSSTRGVRRPTRATGSRARPPLPVRLRPPALTAEPAPRLGEHTDALPPKPTPGANEPKSAPRTTVRRGCRSRGCGSST